MSGKHHILEYARAILEGIGVVLGRENKQIGGSIVVGIAVHTHNLGIKTCQLRLDVVVLHSHDNRVLQSVTGWSILASLKHSVQ